MRNSKRLLWVLLMVVAVGMVGPGVSVAEKNALATDVRLGVFDSWVVALPYGRSTQADGMLTEVKALRTELKKAESAGDKKLIAKIEA